MPQHMQIKTSHILKSCSLSDPFRVFFSQERIIKSNHYLTVSIKKKLAHPEVLKDQCNVFFFFSAKYSLSVTLPESVNVLTSNAVILTHLQLNSGSHYFFISPHKNKSSLQKMKKIECLQFKKHVNYTAQQLSALEPAIVFQ